MPNEQEKSRTPEGVRLSNSQRRHSRPNQDSRASQVQEAEWQTLELRLAADLLTFDDLEQLASTVRGRGLLASWIQGGRNVGVARGSAEDMRRAADELDDPNYTTGSVEAAAAMFSIDVEALEHAARLGVGLSVRNSAENGAVLDATVSWLSRFVAYPSEHACLAHALWILHTWLMDEWESTPRIAFLSPEPGSGKTRALEVTEPLVPNPVEAVNVTPTYLFRRVGEDGQKPTVLFDEIDTVFGPKARENEDIRGLLNAGHRRGAVAGRCVVKGKTVTTEELPAYSAVALAGIGDLPDTLLTRSVVIRMRRRAPGEKVEPYRRRVHAAEGEALKTAIVEWAESVRDQLDWPTMPAGIEDRDADVWESLLAVADAAGGHWPERARVSAVTLVTQSKGSTPSLGVRLLADLKSIFDEADGPDALFSETLISSLTALDEAPWGELYGGQPLTKRGLAQRLRQYEISSTTVRVGDNVAKGYKRVDLADAWKRYVDTSDTPSPPSRKGVTSVTSVTSAEDPATLFTDGQADLDASPTAGERGGDSCRCGSAVERFTPDGIPRCEACGPPDDQLEDAAPSMSGGERWSGETF